MDSRQTIDRESGFIELLKQLYHDGETASLLVDDNGLTRMEGLLTRVQTAETGAWIELDHSSTIPVKLIVAVNGTFHPDYSEC